MVDPLTISTVASLAKGIISRIWPDPIEQAKHLRELAVIEQRGDLAELEAYTQGLTGQIDINKIEAAHPSVFVSGWRPFIGWVGGASLAYQFILYPMLIWVWAIFKVKGVVPAELEPPPMLETSALFSIVTAMLGIGAMRSHDKKHGVDTKGKGK